MSGYSLDFRPEHRAHGMVETASILDADFTIQPTATGYLAECHSYGLLCASEEFPNRAAAVAACLDAFKL